MTIHIIGDTSEILFKGQGIKKDFNQQGHQFFSPFHTEEEPVKILISKSSYENPKNEQIYVSQLDSMFNCDLCGEYPSLVLDKSDPNNLKVIVGKSPCQYKDGFTYDVTITVPSGELVIADFFRLDKKPEKYISINSNLGQKHHAEFLEENNVAYAQLSDGGYEVYRDLTTGIIYVGELYDSETDELLVPDGCEMLGTIYCDVWSVNITDSKTHDTSKKPRKESSILRVKVPAGEYVLTNYTTLNGHECNTGIPGVVHAILQKKTD